jgi:orotidine-5'-phosphate decarboxylase
MKKDKLILALDVDNLKKAEELIEMLYPTVRIFKIGNQLFTAAGTKAIELVHKRKAEVFLDLKFHDIPNTVANTARVVAGLGVFMFNLHTSGGLLMMQKAKEACEEESKKLKTRRPLILGVTVLTSLTQSDLLFLGMANRSLQEEVLFLAKLAQKAGLDGVICSAHELKTVRQEVGKDFVLLCPGVRPQGEAKQDQQRVLTPREAVQDGADFLVVGRPITQAADPLKAAKEILAEMK